MLTRIPIPSVNAPGCHNDVPVIEPKACLVGINATRHPYQAEDVHGEESDVKSNEHDPEADFAKALVHHATGHLGQPVIEPCKDGEKIRADQYVVDVADHVISVVCLPIDGYDAGKYATESANDEHHDRGDREVH